MKAICIAMTTELIKTGISVVGDMPWGTHFCHFYETKQDLLDTVVPYFKAGLENKEFCLWVISDSDLITVEEAKGALAQAVTDLERHLADENIEILNGQDWYFEKNLLNLERVKNAWDEKLKRALARGYDGMRASGDTLWLAEKDWKDFCAYEKQVNDWITDQFMTVLCTYPLAKSGAMEVLDVVQSHQFVIARRQGEWEAIETPRLIQAKAEIKRLNEELEQRVIERTNELRVANEELWKEIAEREQAEGLLHAKEQEFRAIIENAPDQIIRYDRDFRRVYVNPAVAKAYGLPREALIGKTIGSVIEDAGLDVKEDELNQLRQHIANVFDSGQSYEYELNWPLPTGRAYFSVHLFPELDLNGSVVNVLGISRDITQRKVAEEELKKEKEILEKIFDNIPVMIGFVGDDGVKLVNPEWERTMGWTLKELQEQNVDIFAEAYPDPSYRREVLKCIAAATGEWVDLKIRVRDGRVIDAACAVVHLSDGTRVGIAQDITERKQAEEKLKQSESRLAEAQRLAHVGSFEWDLRTNAVTWSDELYRIFDLQRGKISLAADAMSLIHPEDRDLVFSTVKSSIKSKEPYSFHYRVLRPNGDERIVHSRGYIVSDEHGVPIRVFEATQDVTERRQAEDELRRQKEILQQIFDHIPVMINFADANGRIKLVNREWERTLGWSLEEIRQQNLDIFAECYPDPQYRQQVLKFVAEAKGKWTDFKTRVRDGRVIDTAFVRVHLSDGTRIGIGKDITERKQVEEALREAEQKYRDIFENAGEGIFQSTPDGRYIAANPALARMYRFASPEELIHSRQDISLQVYVDPTRREEFKHQLEEQGVVRGFEFEIFRKDGSRLWISVNAHAVRDEQGAIQYYEGTAQDINERKAAEENLKATSEQLRALSARLQSAREEEGTRIAREIHDELGSALTSLKWDLEEMAKMLSTSRHQSEHAALRKKLQAAIRQADTAISAIREIASELRPSILTILDWWRQLNGRRSSFRRARE